MIGTTGVGYQVQFALTVKGGGQATMWMDHETYPLKTQAVQRAKLLCKGNSGKVRVVMIRAAVVWASEAAKVAAGASLKD